MSIRKLIAATAIAGAALSSAPALAVTPTTQADGKALVLVPLTLTKIDDLDFGSVIPSAAGGTVTLDPLDGTRTPTGGVTLVPGDAGNHAYFAGAGSPNQQVLIALSPPVSLKNSAGDTIPVVGLTLDGPPMRTIDPTTRAFFVGVGGILGINANQTPGTYSATFQVTANYL